MDRVNILITPIRRYSVQLLTRWSQKWTLSFQVQSILIDCKFFVAKQKYFCLNFIIFTTIHPSHLNVRRKWRHEQGCARLKDIFIKCKSSSKTEPSNRVEVDGRFMGHHRPYGRTFDSRAISPSTFTIIKKRTREGRALNGFLLPVDVACSRAALVVTWRRKALSKSLIK